MDVILYFKPVLNSYSKPEKLAGVLEIAGKAKIHVQVIEDEPTRIRINRLREFWEAKGAIVECGGRKHQVDPKDFGNLPTVFFNREFSTLPRTAFAVRHDSRATGRLAAKELLLAGADNLAYIPAPGEPFWSQERKQGFAEALKLNGKSCRTLIWPRHAESTTNRNSILRKFLTTLKLPCSVFAANDYIAAEVITAARMCKLAVPDDLAVLGVDNSKSICEHTVPTLTSIEPDFRRGGNLTMLMLLAILQDGETFRGPRQRTFGDLSVIRRMSTQRLLRPDPHVANALNLIRKEACNGITAIRVAATFPCSRRMTDIRFRRATGHSILDEIQSVRLERAKELLTNANQELKSISDFCGFKNPNSLRKFFLKETGKTLSAWRKAMANNQSLNCSSRMAAARASASL